MEALRKHTYLKLLESRSALLSIPKDALTGAAIRTWLNRWRQALDRADSIDSGMLINTIEYQVMHAFWDETDHDICLDLRDRIVAYMEYSIARLGNQAVKPVLDDYIGRVADKKLAVLLREFNTVRSGNPNLAAIGFRTILPLIIRERAKRVDPADRLATKDDIGFEPDIVAAVKHGSLFNAAESRLLKRYLQDGNKDSFDNVAHKPEYLIDGSELEAAVTLLNRLLPTIID